MIPAQQHKDTHRFGLGETTQRLDGLGDKSEGPRGRWVLTEQGDVKQNLVDCTVQSGNSGTRVSLKRRTHRVVRQQMEQVRGEDGWREEAQEDETAHRCVTDVLVHCVEEKKGVHIIPGFF